MGLRVIDTDSTRAWVACVAAATANGIAFGTAYTFGTFFDSMATEFGSERGSTALLFGVTLLFFFGFGVVSGPLSDRFGHHRLFLVGGTIYLVGLGLTSQADSVGVGYLTYGVGVGVGAGCFVAPFTALVGQLFLRKRALALGIVATGNGLGTLILNPLSERLIDTDGWRSAYLTLCIGTAIIFVIVYPAVSVRPAAVIRPPLASEPNDPGPLAHASASAYDFVKSTRFAALFASGALMSIGLFVAFAFVVPFATDEGVSTAAAARLVAIIGLTSIVGRLGLTNLSQRYGSLRIYQGALLMQPVAFVVWLVAGGSYPLLVLFAAVLGVSYGGFVAVAPALLIDELGLESLGRKMGLMFMSFGLGGLVGPPAAGWVADATDGRTASISIVIVILILALITTAPLNRAVPT